MAIHELVQAVADHPMAALHGESAQERELVALGAAAVPLIAEALRPGRLQASGDWRDIYDALCAVLVQIAAHHESTVRELLDDHTLNGNVGVVTWALSEAARIRSLRSGA